MRPTYPHHWKRQLPLIWAILPIFLPVIYYHYASEGGFSFKWEFISKNLPVLSLSAEHFKTYEPQQYKTAYVLALFLAVIGLPLSFIGYLKSEKQHYEWLKGENGYALKRETKRTVRLCKPSSIIFLTIFAFIAPMWMIGIGYYEQLLPIYLIALPLLVLQMFGMAIAQIIAKKHLLS